MSLAENDPDAVYELYIPFDVDGSITQMSVAVRAGQTAEQAVNAFCTAERPGPCNDNDPGVVAQLLGIVEDTIQQQRQRLYPNSLLLEILESRRVRDASGKVLSLDSNVAVDEGRYLYDLVVKHNMTRTLEVGMAFGVSSLFIAQAHQDLGHGVFKVTPVGEGFADDDRSLRPHVAVDPFQSTQWESVGALNLMRARLRHLVDIMELESHFALPNIARHEAGSFQLCFIDGMHLFDFTLLDFYYSDLLLAPGGFAVFDDSLMPSVQKVIAHALTNRAYVQVDNGLNSGRVVTLQKQAKDNRSWDFHVDF